MSLRSWAWIYDTQELEVNTSGFFFFPEVGRNMRVSHAKQVESSYFLWDNITRGWDNAVPTRSRYFPEGEGRAVVGHPAVELL